MMSPLYTVCRIAAPDDVYELIVDLHRGLDEQRSAVVNSKLILLLMNQIGDVSVIQAAIEAARLDTSLK